MDTVLFLILVICSIVVGHVALEDTAERERSMHPDFTKFKTEDISVEASDFWSNDAQEKLNKKVEVQRIENVAKNVIFYLGDGMSIHTLTAARIFKGQAVDHLQYGEEAELYMEGFPFTGTSKSFCSDAQIADGACSATAYLCGSKANEATIGVTPDVQRSNCSAQADTANHLTSVLEWARVAGKSTGIVTTASVTDASPAGTYAHIANRAWENDADVKSSGGDPNVCEDIASQLITKEPGRSINVILGGGRRHFMPTTVMDPEYTNIPGNREDGVNLIDTWIFDKNASGSRASFITGRDQLLKINETPEDTDYLLGLFNPSHISYLNQQEANNDPSLEEMTAVAISILSKNPAGFFLFVEGGRIDHAHHTNLVQRSLWETIELDKAIQKGDELTEDEDTLIVVTADHASSMAFAGYPARGTPILEFPRLFLTTAFLPYNTLHYVSGPGPVMFDETGKRKSIWGDNFYSTSYQVPSPIPMEAASHGGEDVLIFGKGPYAHFYEGVHQQSYIPHVIGYAACIGSGAVSKECKMPTPITDPSATTPTTDSSTTTPTTDPSATTQTPISTTTDTGNSSATKFWTSGMSIRIFVAAILIVTYI